MSLLTDSLRTCKFCSKFSDVRNTENIHDSILLESGNFVVVPTYGSIVEGWVMIVSKHHYLSVGELLFQNRLNSEIHHEFQKLKEAVIDKLRLSYNLNIAIFEHGPAKCFEKVGCGIDHLHLHVLPLEFNLLHEATLYKRFEWLTVDDIHNPLTYFSKGQPYLYIQQNMKEYISTNHEIPSQFFRRVIANKLNIAEKFDWKENNFSANIEATLSKSKTRIFNEY